VYKDLKNGFSRNEESKDDQGGHSAFDNKKYKKNKKRTEQRRANKHNQRQQQMSEGANSNYSYQASYGGVGNYQPSGQSQSYYGQYFQQKQPQQS
jgi:hypothetical protein